MQYVFAFIIFLIIINVLGFLFSFLWPFIVALVIVVAVLNLLAYHKRKKAMEDFYQDVEDFQNQSYYNSKDDHQDDVIDVEFSEEDIDEER